MAIRDVVTMGYGSFSRVELIPVLGYGLGSDYIPPGTPTMEYQLGHQRMHWELPPERTHYQMNASRMHYVAEET